MDELAEFYLKPSKSNDGSSSEGEADTDETDSETGNESKGETESDMDSSDSNTEDSDEESDVPTDQDQQNVETTEDSVELELAAIVTDAIQRKDEIDDEAWEKCQKIVADSFVDDE